MEEILVVEGQTDVVFFYEILVRLFLQNPESRYGYNPGRQDIPGMVRGTDHDGAVLEVAFRNVEGKAAIPSPITAFLESGVSRLMVAQDLDYRFAGEVASSIRQVVDAHRGPDLPGDAVTVIPMGLPGDSALEELGVRKHEMEDYLIKLMLEDQTLRQGIPEFGRLVSEIIAAVRSYGVPFDSGKEVFQLVKPIVKLGFNDNVVVRRIIQEANADTLRSVLGPILVDLEHALGM